MSGPCASIRIAQTICQWSVVCNKRSNTFECESSKLSLFHSTCLMKSKAYGSEKVPFSVSGDEQNRRDYIVFLCDDALNIFVLC